MSVWQILNCLNIITNSTIATYSMWPDKMGTFTNFVQYFMQNFKYFWENHSFIDTVLKKLYIFFFHFECWHQILTENYQAWPYKKDAACIIMFYFHILMNKNFAKVSQAISKKTFYIFWIETYEKSVELLH